MYIHGQKPLMVFSLDLASVLVIHDSPTNRLARSEHDVTTVGPKFVLYRNAELFLHHFYFQRRPLKTKMESLRHLAKRAMTGDTLHRRRGKCVNILDNTIEPFASASLVAGHYELFFETELLEYLEISQYRRRD